MVCGVVSVVIVIHSIVLCGVVRVMMIIHSIVTCGVVWRGLGFVDHSFNCDMWHWLAGLGRDDHSFDCV